MQTAFAGGEMMSGLQRKLLDQETAKALAEVEVFEDRAKVFERMQRGQLQSADDIERLRREFDQRGLVREEEWKELHRTYREREEDRNVAREHTRKLMAVNQQLEVARAALALQQAQRGLSESNRAEEVAEMEHQLQARRQQAIGALADDWAKARQQDDEERLRAARDFDEASQGIDLLVRMKTLKSQEADQEAERRLREQRVTAELYRTLTPEALIAMAGSEKAGILADLRRTELLKSFSEDQILAMAAQSSPAVAQAIQEKYKVNQQNVEQMLRMQAEHSAQIHRAMDKNADRMQEMFNRGMDTQRDTAVATARAGQPAVTVVTQGAGAGVMPIGSGATPAPPVQARVTICPKCNQETAAGNRFCDKCGHRFYE